MMVVYRSLKGTVAGGVASCHLFTRTGWAMPGGVPGMHVDENYLKVSVHRYVKDGRTLRVAQRLGWQKFHRAL